MPRVASNRVGINHDGNASVPAKLLDSQDFTDGSSNKLPEADTVRAKRQKELLRKKKAERRAHAKQRAEQARQLQEQQQWQQQLGAGSDAAVTSTVDGASATTHVADGNDRSVKPVVVELADQRTVNSINNLPSDPTSAPNEDNQRGYTQLNAGNMAGPSATLHVDSTETDRAHPSQPELQRRRNDQNLSTPLQDSPLDLRPTLINESESASTMSTMTAITVTASTVETATDLGATVPKPQSKRKKKKKSSARSSAQEAATTIQKALKKNLIKCKSLVRHSSKVFAGDSLPESSNPRSGINEAPNNDEHMPLSTDSNTGRVSMERLLPRITSGSILGNKVQPISGISSVETAESPRLLQALSGTQHIAQTLAPTGPCNNSAANSPDSSSHEQEITPATSIAKAESTRVTTPPASSESATNLIRPSSSLDDATTEGGHVTDSSHPRHQRRKTRASRESGSSQAIPSSSRSSITRSSSPSCSSPRSSSRSSYASDSSSCSCSSASYSASSSENDEDETKSRRSSRKRRHRDKLRPTPPSSTVRADLEAMAVRIQSHMRGIFGRERARAKREELDAQLRAEALHELENDACVTIQARARGFLAHRHINDVDIGAKKKKRREVGKDDSQQTPGDGSRLDTVNHNTDTHASPGDGKSEEDEKMGIWPEELNLEALDDWEELGELANVSGERITHARFLSRGQLRVFCGTWNMHAKKPSDDNLRLWIRRNKYHIVAIGTEECVHSIAKSVVFTSKKSWEKQLRDALGEEYTLVASHALTATHNAVFVHESTLPLLSHVQSDAVATGLGNQLGNKGGVGIALCVGGTSFLFVNCHFDAHQRNVEKRNANFHRINQELKLYAPADSLTATTSVVTNARKSMPATTPTGPGGVTSRQNSRQSMTGSTFASANGQGSNSKMTATRRLMAADRFDRVFWFGDLNYRVNGTRRMVDLLLLHDQHAVLRFNDQLSAEVTSGRVFPHFREGPLHFRPTYKFDKHSAVYDSSPKQRIPSWTDRVLFRSNGHATDVEVLSYRSHMSFQNSDHRPVGAVFQVAFSPLATVDGAATAMSLPLQPGSPPKDSAQQQPPLASADTALNEFGRVVARGYRASQSKSEVCALM